jgi:multidrug resistance efflux pump
LLAHRQKLALAPNPVAAVDVSASEMQVRELEELERVESQRLADLQAEDTEGEARRAERNVAMAEARRDQARLALDECRAKAPRHGTILRILVGPGDLLAGDRGHPAIMFAADGPQVIRATLEQEFAARVKEGEPALVHDDANSEPSRSWRGRVEREAGWYSQRRAVLHDPAQISDVRTLECVIVLEPGQPRLRLGQAVCVPRRRADVIGPTSPHQSV